jgi:hypothetical protein
MCQRGAMIFARLEASRQCEESDRPASWNIVRSRDDDGSFLMTQDNYTKELKTKLLAKELKTLESRGVSVATCARHT